MDNTILSESVQQFITLLSFKLVEILVPLAVTALILLISKARSWISSKLSEQQESTLNLLVEMAVMAAEQSGLTGAIRDEGREKKEFALRLLQDMLEARGLNRMAANLPELSARIEAAILQGLQRKPAIVEAVSLTDTVAPVREEPAGA